MPGEVFDAIVFADTGGPRAGESTEPILLVAPADRDEFELDVWLVATRHFLILDSPLKSLTLRRDEDRSGTVAFRVRVEHPPSADEEPLISASFSYHGRPSGRVTLTLSASHERVAQAEGTGLVVDVDAVQPDLTVEIVSLENDGRRFEVRIDTPLVRLEERTQAWSLPSESPALVAQTMLRFFDQDASRQARIASLLGAGSSSSTRLRSFSRTPSGGFAMLGGRRGISTSCPMSEASRGSSWFRIAARSQT
jgi:hypothetical protein